MKKIEISSTRRTFPCLHLSITHIQVPIWMLAYQRFEVVPTIIPLKTDICLLLKPMITLLLHSFILWMRTDQIYHPILILTFFNTWTERTQEPFKEPFLLMRTPTEWTQVSNIIEEIQTILNIHPLVLFPPFWIQNTPLLLLFQEWTWSLKNGIKSVLLTISHPHLNYTPFKLMNPWKKSNRIHLIMELTKLQWTLLFLFPPSPLWQILCPLVVWLPNIRESIKMILHYLHPLPLLLVHSERVMR